jgi:hypothetical protein
MNQSQISGIVRIIVPAVLAYAAGAGWIKIEDSAAYTDAIVGSAVGLVSLAMLIWSGFANTHSQTVASAAAIPEVSKVEIKPTTEGTELMAKVGGYKPDALVVFAPR